MIIASNNYTINLHSYMVSNFPNNNNSFMIIWFQVFLSYINNLHTYDFKYWYLIQMVCTQLKGFK